MILEIHLSDEERQLLLNDPVLGYPGARRMPWLSSSAERWGITLEDARAIINSQDRHRYDLRKQEQIDRNRAWEQENGLLGEEMFVDEQGYVHDPLGYRLAQVRNDR